MRQQSKLLIRASMLGNIMGQPQLKADKEVGNLSQTAKSYLNELWIEENYGRIKDIRNKYLTKGIEQEDESIDLLSNVSGEFFIKNETHYQNAYIKGTPDVVTNDLVIDIKTSWDIFTFHKASLTSNYEWQLKAYMWLTGKPKAKLVYCLVDCPQWMIEKELLYATNDLPLEESEKKEKQIIKNMTFSDIPEQDRVKSFELELSKEDIELIKLKVKKAREYYETVSL